MNVSISPANLADAGALASLRIEVARGMTQRFGKGHWSTLPSKAVVVRQLRASRVFVARRDGEIVGTVRLAAADPFAIGANCFAPVKSAFYVLGLADAPGARRNGIARQLMEAAKEAARAQSVQALWLDTYDHAAGAGPFYSKCGFRAVGHTRRGDVPLVYYEWLTD